MKKSVKKTTKVKKTVMAKFSLTCLNCKEEIEEHTDAKLPAAMIFHCIKCGKQWGVVSMTVHEGKGTNVQP